MNNIEMLESERLAIQSQLDAAKTPDERNRMGQFATPTLLARDILRYGLDLLPSDEPVRFLDPGIGTGAFYSALLAVVGERSIKAATGFEVDPHYGNPSRELWRTTPLTIHHADFTTASPSTESGSRANLLICNPPYVRHHHLDSATKARLALRTEQACGVPIRGLSGLYCYFMGLAHPWMDPGAIGGWLIPSEFMGVNYGRMLKEYLLKEVTLLHIHRFDPSDVQFADALVSSAIVWIKNTPPSANHTVRFTYGGSLSSPSIERLVGIADLQTEPKWTRYPQAVSARPETTLTLGDLFDVKRGLATGDNSYFVMDAETIAANELPIEVFRPILPSSRHIPDDEITADANGWPQLSKQLFLLDTRLNEAEIAERFPTLKSYLERGTKGAKPVSDGYLCKARRPWYSQENRPPAPIVCTYMGRTGKTGGKPFRFILNHSNATALNTYLMLYPKPSFAAVIRTNPDALRITWAFLNAIDAEDLLSHGRVYGGGLHKLEPKELRGFPAEDLIAELGGVDIKRHGSLFDDREVA